MRAKVKPKTLIMLVILVGLAGIYLIACRKEQKEPPKITTETKSKEPKIILLSNTPIEVSYKIGDHHYLNGTVVSNEPNREVVRIHFFAQSLINPEDKSKNHTDYDGLIETISDKDIAQQQKAGVFTGSVFIEDPKGQILESQKYVNGELIEADKPESKCSQCRKAARDKCAGDLGCLIANYAACLIGPACAGCNNF